MRPSKSTMDMEVKSLKKKFKDKKFAAGCSREIIAQGGAQMLGWELDELFDKTIQAMRSCEADVAQAMGRMLREQFAVCFIDLVHKRGHFPKR